MLLPFPFKTCAIMTLHSFLGLSNVCLLTVPPCPFSAIHLHNLAASLCSFSLHMLWKRLILHALFPRDVSQKCELSLSDTKYKFICCSLLS